MSDSVAPGPPTALNPRRSFCRRYDPCVGGECTSCQRCPPPLGPQPSRADCCLDEGSGRCAGTYSDSWAAAPRESSHLRAAGHSYFYPPPGLALPDNVDAAPRRQGARVETAQSEPPCECAPPPTPSSASDRRSVKSAAAEAPPAQRPAGRRALELFSGSGRLMAALESRGWTTDSMDLTLGKQFDLLRRSLQSQVPARSRHVSVRPSGASLQFLFHCTMPPRAFA